MYISIPIILAFESLISLPVSFLIVFAPILTMRLIQWFPLSVKFPVARVAVVFAPEFVVTVILVGTV